MSAAPVGYVKVLIWGVPFSFDGNVWTYPENFPACIEEHARRHYFPKGGEELGIIGTLEAARFMFEYGFRDLNEYKPWRHISHHTPLRRRAEIILSEAIGKENEDWWIVECIPDPAWDEPLPPGSVD